MRLLQVLASLSTLLLKLKMGYEEGVLLQGFAITSISTFFLVLTEVLTLLNFASHSPSATKLKTSEGNVKVLSAVRQCDGYGPGVCLFPRGRKLACPCQLTGVRFWLYF